MKQNSIFQSAFASVRSSYVSVAIVSMVINILMLTGPLFMLQVYDRVLASSSIPTLIVIASLAIGLYIFYGILEAVRSRILTRICQRVDAQLSAETYAISTSLPLTLGPKATKLRPVQDLDTLRQFLSGTGPAAMFDLPWLPLYLGIVFLFHPILGLVALCGGLIICALIGLKEVYSRKPALEFAQENARRAGLVEISRRNSEVVRAMGMMDTLKERWIDANNDYLEKQRATADASGTFSTFVKSFRLLLQSAVLGVGAWLAIGQEVSPGIMIAASIMTSRALAPIELAVAHWSAFVAARQSKQRLKGILDNGNNADTPMELPLPTKTLTVDQVACGPAGIKQVVAQGIMFDLTAGDGLGIIGPSGSGKSTVARAIVGVTPALKGAIRFDGAELEQFAPDKVGQFIGYLPQDIQLFDGSVSENISRFMENAEPEAVIETARLADVHDMITALPDGYNTMIGVSGYALSAGQQQRIALARALYKNPFLIVLDEPNSNLDSEGEAALTNAIKAMREAGSIVIVIAHRPSAIAAVNKILVLKDGQQSAFGPKDEVLQKVIVPVQHKVQPRR